MSNIQLDYSDITDIFKEKLKIDNIVKKVVDHHQQNGKPADFVNEPDPLFFLFQRESRLSRPQRALPGYYSKLGAEIQE